MRIDQISVATGATSASSATVRGFVVSDLAFAPRVRLAEHEHERPCLAVLLDGAVDKAFRLDRLVVSRGGAITMPAQLRHADRFAPSGARILVIEPADDRDGSLAPCSRLWHHVHSFTGGLGRSAARLSMELDSPDPLSPLALEGGSLELLAEAARLAEPRQARRAPSWLPQVEERLRSEPPVRATIAELAADASVHPVHLIRVFRRHYGVTPAAYLRRVRLDWTARELSRSDDTLATIARRAGYADQSHFTRAFRAATGLTPDGYRRATRR